MPFALQRGVSDIAAYPCERLTRDPKAFFRLFDGLNLWVLTESSEGKARFEPAAQADFVF